MGRTKRALAGAAAAAALSPILAPAIGRTKAPPSDPPPSAPCAYMQAAPPAAFTALAQAAVLKPGGAAEMAAALKDAKVQAMIAAQGRFEAAQKAQDWAQLCYYKEADKALSGGPPVDVVMLGDSITEFWRGGDPGLFGDGKVVDRGISGQTSSQVLLRFYSDVVTLRPGTVHLMVGTNDIAGNTGPIDDDAILGNIEAMIDVAQAHGIRVVLASIPPMRVVPWRPVVSPAARVARLNIALQRLTARKGVVFANYYVAMADPQGGLPTRLSNDGVHPTRTGYAVMRPVFDNALREAREVSAP